MKRENLKQFGDRFHLGFEPTTETKRITFSVPFWIIYFSKILPFLYKVWTKQTKMAVQLS